MGTKAFYFDSTLKYGGAKYRPTGRGFVMRHEEFAELFRFYAGSHLYNGAPPFCVALRTWQDVVSAV
eukprot:scaffold107329_cov30-Tisochrysis_lutea.AAC.4